MNNRGARRTPGHVYRPVVREWGYGANGVHFYQLLVVVGLYHAIWRFLDSICAESEAELPRGQVGRSL
jgi:hypothetical protein